MPRLENRSCIDFLFVKLCDYGNNHQAKDDIILIISWRLVFRTPCHLRTCHLCKTKLLPCIFLHFPERTTTVCCIVQISRAPFKSRGHDARHRVLALTWVASSPGSLTEIAPHRDWSKLPPTNPVKSSRSFRSSALPRHVITTCLVSYSTNFTTSRLPLHTQQKTRRAHRTPLIPIHPAIEKPTPVLIGVAQPCLNSLCRHRHSRPMSTEEVSAMPRPVSLLFRYFFSSSFANLSCR